MVLAITPYLNPESRTCSVLVTVCVTKKKAVLCGRRSVLVLWNNKVWYLSLTPKTFSPNWKPSTPPFPSSTEQTRATTLSLSLSPKTHFVQSISLFLVLIICNFGLSIHSWSPGQLLSLSHSFSLTFQNPHSLLL